MSSSGVMLSGWLRKSPPERKLRRNAWKKRWFVLRSGRLSGDPNLLEYYRHQASKRPIRAISLDECSQIDANVPIKYEKKDPAEQFVFDIVTNTRTYYLVAESNLEMSSWVGRLCDLCGFNHHENQQDIGTQQQTFKAVQPITGRTFQNGTTPLLENESRYSVEVPVPLPRPLGTITNRSVLIRDKATDANDNNIRSDESPLMGRRQSSSTSGSGHVSIAGSPPMPRKLDSSIKNNGYSYACEPSQTQQENASDYLLLTDCETVTSTRDPPDDSNLLSVSKMNERRLSTDSVFTHDGRFGDSGSDEVVTKQIKPAHMRFVANNARKQRLDSMPDCPPPPPPVNGYFPQINATDERGYSYPPDDVIDEDVVMEARGGRSCRSSHGLSPIDDSDLNRVPPNLQREHKVDEMGKPVSGSHVSSSSSSRFAGYSVKSHSSNFGSEYINTADASSEVGIGSYGSIPRHMEVPSHQQVYPIPGQPFLSPANISGSAQFSKSPVFFNSPTPGDSAYNSPRNHFYDATSPMSSMYASPKIQYPHCSPLSKASIYSSASTLSPYAARGSPVRINSPYSPHRPMPKMRRSSSVGQLENVANELAAKTNETKSPTHTRRCSIDHRHERVIYNSPTQPYHVQPGFYASPAPYNFSAGDTTWKSGVPPPRPPKSEGTIKQTISEYSNSSAHFDQNASSEYCNINGNADNLTHVDSAELSPSHTAVIPMTSPDSPPHSEVVAVIENPQLEDHKPNLSPAHTTVIHTIPATENGDSAVKEAKEKASFIRRFKGQDGSRSTSSSSTCSGSTSASSRSRSPSAVYDIPTASIQHPHGDPSRGSNNASLYDVPSSKSPNSPIEGASVYDTAKLRSAAPFNGNSPTDYDCPRKFKSEDRPGEVGLYDSPKSTLEAKMNNCSLYDTPKAHVANSNLPAEIDDVNHPNYEMMLDQEESSEAGIDDTQLYTCMAGSAGMVMSPPFMTNKQALSPAMRTPTPSEPPPVKRDLKPGRKSLGSDGGSSESSKPHYSRSSYEDSHSDVLSPGSQSLSSDCPVSPPHTTIMHSMPSPQIMDTRGFEMTVRSHDRLFPPERPPKHPSQGSMSPRTPPSATSNIHLPGRPSTMPYSVDRSHIMAYDNQMTRSPSLIHQTPRQRSTPPVPGRPPKPISMKHDTLPSSSMWDDGSYNARNRDFNQYPQRPLKTSIVFPPDYGAQYPPKSASNPVPPPPMDHAEKQLTYVEIANLPSNDGPRSGSADHSTGTSERLPKGGDAVEYISLDREKTEALQKIMLEREKEQSQQKRTSSDNKSIKGGR